MEGEADHMVKYKVLALDLDETVLTPNKEISEKNRMWITRAAEAGVVVVLTTGRGLQRVEQVRKELDLESPMVLANGAEVWSKPGELVKRYYIGQKDIRMLHALAIESGGKFWGYNDTDHIKMEDWTDDTFETNFFKFGISHKDVQIVQQLRDELKKWETINVTWSSNWIVEISLAGVSKATGIQRLCDYLGIEMADVMAIGDNQNDLELIQSAGLGVAMGNAENVLKRAADQITRTNEEDGVANAIQNYLFQNESI